MVLDIVSMASEQVDMSSSITVPLLAEEEVEIQNHVNGSNGVLKAKDDIDDLHHVGNTSFFKTCFHGINAISGIYFTYIYINLTIFSLNFHLVFCVSLQLFTFGTFPCNFLSSTCFGVCFCLTLSVFASFWCYI